MVRQSALTALCASSNLAGAAIYIFLWGEIMNQELAELLFPNIDKTPEDIEKLFPKRDIKEGAMVTRFGPSPTGFMHIGNLWGAFLDSIMAHQTGGICYLRMEDTDDKREVEGAKELVLNSLNHFHVEYDEGYGKEGIYGPYVQSERKDIYQVFAKELVKNGQAYPSFMTEEELQEIREGQELRKEITGIYGHYAIDRDLSLEEVKNHLANGDSYVIRIKSPGDMNKQVILHDCIKGDILLPENIIDEVILKKNGIPTYHFAHVVDDHLMKTTHVIRGDEWIPSYPKHLQLFQMLGWKTPKYAHHATLTKKEDGKIRKLSKRKDPEFSVSYYKEAGIPAEAVRLYLATLTNTNFEEWYLQNKDKSLDDFTFSYKKMPVGGTLFDIEKLNNICRTYFSRLTAIQVYEDCLTYNLEYDSAFAQLMEQNKDILIAFLNIERDSKRPRKDIATYKDLKQESFYMLDPLFYEDGKVTYQMPEDKKYNVNLLEEYGNVFVENDSYEQWYERIKHFAQDHGYASEVKEYKNNPDQYKGHVGDICEMIRFAVTGRTRTPDLYQILTILGKEKLQKRIKFFKNYLQER